MADTAAGSSREQRLAALNVAVIGAGRIGTSLLRNLARIGVRRVDVFESDPTVADALRDEHTVHLGDFWDTLTLARLRDYDFAVCTVDDAQARVRMNQKCLVANVNLVQAWAEGGLAIAAAFPFGALEDGACYECDAGRGATPMPLASLKLSVDESPGDAVGDAAVVAGALAAAIVARVATGAHGAVARRATLDTRSGAGGSVELRRDADCPRCRGLARPVPIVQTRNR